MGSRVVVADDAKSIREIMAFVLRQRKYEVVETADGAAVIPLVREHKPDVLVLDVMMPNALGFDVLAELRRIPELRHLRVLVVTAITEGTDKDDEHWKKKCGADGFISKPFRIQDFVAEVERLMRPAEPPAPPVMA